MLIKILGTRGEIESSSPGHVKQSGVLIDNKLLLDIGEPEYLGYKPGAIVITHLHPDHAFFMRRKESVNITIPVFGPEAAEQQAIELLSTAREIEGYQVTPVPTIHSARLPSQGYIIQKGGKRIFYSGDLVAIEKKYLQRLGRLDLVITEASFMRKGGMVRTNEEGKKSGHAGISDLVELFSPYTHRIVFTHFGTWFMKEPVKAMEKILSLNKKGLRLDIATDGAEYTI
jgi:ribonuclease BN (tRNA processing enzyme)